MGTLLFQAKAEGRTRKEKCSLRGANNHKFSFPSAFTIKDYMAPRCLVSAALTWANKQNDFYHLHTTVSPRRGPPGNGKVLLLPFATAIQVSQLKWWKINLPESHAKTRFSMIVKKEAMAWKGENEADRDRVVVESSCLEGRKKVERRKINGFGWNVHKKSSWKISVPAERGRKNDYKLFPFI